MPTLLASQRTAASSSVAPYLPTRLEAGLVGSPQPQEATKVVIHRNFGNGNKGGSVVFPAQRPLMQQPHRLTSGSVVVTSTKRADQGNRITLPSGGSVVLQPTPVGMGVRRSFSPVRRNTTSMGPCKGFEATQPFQPRPCQSLGDRGPMPSIATSGLSGSPLPVFRPSPSPGPERWPSPSPSPADEDCDCDDIDETIPMNATMIEQMFEVSTAAFRAAGEESDASGQKATVHQALSAVIPTVMEEPDEVMALPAVSDRRAPSLPPMPMQEPTLPFQPEMRARPSPLLDLSSASQPPRLMAPQLGQQTGDDLDVSHNSGAEVRLDGLAPPPRRAARDPESPPKLELPRPSPLVQQPAPKPPALSNLDETVNVIPTSRPTSGSVSHSGRSSNSDGNNSNGDGDDANGKGPALDNERSLGALDLESEEWLLFDEASLPARSRRQSRSQGQLQSLEAEEKEGATVTEQRSLRLNLEKAFEEQSELRNSNSEPEAEAEMDQTGTVPTPPRASTPSSPAYWDPADPMMNKVGDWQDKFMSAWMGDLAMPGFDDE